VERIGARWFAPQDAHVRRYARFVAAASGMATLVYVAVLWDFRFAPLRTALPAGDFSGFYDLQARSLLDGHLSVPRGSLGIEGFIIHGREYMYFPPGPALARIPLFLLTSRFDGRLTAVSMLLAWTATLFLIAILTWRVRRVIRWRAPLARWEAAAYACFVVAASAGSVLVYLASMPWVYHEAYAWAIVMALLAAFALLGVIERQTRGRVALCFVSVLGAVLCRATTGWAFGAATIGTAIWFLLGRRGRRAQGFGRRLLLAGLLPLLLGVGINWAKFQHPYLFPLERQEWTRVNEHRQDALAANDGGLVSFDILPTTAASYFRPDGIRFISVPPFITFPDRPATAIGHAFLDQTYRTGSAVPFMPALVLLSIWGVVLAFRSNGPPHAAYLRPPLLGSLLIGGAVMIYGYLSYRYLAEFLPFFIMGGSIGLVGIGYLLSDRSRAHRITFVAALTGLTAFAVAANTAVAWTTERISNPGRPLDAYLSVQAGVSSALPGDPLAAMTERRADIPLTAHGEHLLIVGDCSALYVGQAETYAPWVAADVQELDFQIAVRPYREIGQPRHSFTLRGPEDGLVGVELARALGRNGTVSFERRADGAYRVAYRSDSVTNVGPWLEHGPDLARVTIRPDPPSGNYLLLLNGGDEATEAPLAEYDDHWFHQQNLLLPARSSATEQAKVGVAVRQVETPRPARCVDLLRRLDG
jgi:hypothetical protein